MTQRERAHSGWRAAGRHFPGLDPGDPENARLRLKNYRGGFESWRRGGVEGLVVQDHVTEGIQQAAGEILQAAEQLHGCPSELGRQVSQQTAGFHQLLDHGGDLQQVVVGFEVFRVDAENVFQVEAAVLLAIEALVLNVPAVSSSFVDPDPMMVPTTIAVASPNPMARRNVAGCCDPVLAAKSSLADDEFSAGIIKQCGPHIVGLILPSTQQICRVGCAGYQDMAGRYHCFTPSEQTRLKLEL